MSCESGPRPLKIAPEAIYTSCFVTQSHLDRRGSLGCEKVDKLIFINIQSWTTPVDEIRDDVYSTL